jgi:hypothetical protein
MAGKIDAETPKMKDGLTKMRTNTTNKGDEMMETLTSDVTTPCARNDAERNFW